MIKDASPALFTTELAKEFGVTPRYVRFYRDEGFLVPVRVDDRDLYSASEQRTLSLILLAREIGLSTADMRETFCEDRQSILLTGNIIRTKLKVASKMLEDAMCASQFLEQARLVSERSGDDTTMICAAPDAVAIRGHSNG